MLCGEGRAGDVGTERASQRGSRAVVLADRCRKQGGREHMRVAVWALARFRGPTGPSTSSARARAVNGHANAISWARAST